MSQTPHILEDNTLLCTLPYVDGNVLRSMMSTNASGSAATTRGLGFTPSEDLLLARAWVSARSNGTDQDASVFWKTVTNVFNSASDTWVPPQKRTLQSVRCRWTLVQRVAQKYIAELVAP
jgi:hypothetical protein